MALVYLSSRYRVIEQWSVNRQYGVGGRDRDGEKSTKTWQGKEGGAKRK